MMEAREPVKENCGSGTGIGTLMPTYDRHSNSESWFWGERQFPINISIIESKS
jgi:hypothetical protein